MNRGINNRIAIKRGGEIRYADQPDYLGQKGMHNAVVSGGGGLSQGVFYGDRRDVDLFGYTQGTDDLSIKNFVPIDIEYTNPDDSYKIGVLSSESFRPTVREGGIVIQSKDGFQVFVEDEVGVKTFQSYIKIDESEHISVKSFSSFFASDAGYTIQGVIRRDVRENDLGDDDDIFIDHMYGNLNEQYEEIGRNPNKPINKIFKQGDKTTKALFRNPPFAEEVNVIYEFPFEYNIQSETKEQEILSPENNNKHSTNDENYPATVSEYVDSIKKSIGISGDDDNFLAIKKSRTNKRYNVFNFLDRNKLIERVEGTGVDIYGNILDINRQMVKIDAEGEGGIIILNRKHRRGIAYHFEINSRKENEESDINEFLLKNMSRWFVDIDKEGLTKINIPSSSKYGTTPIFTRYGENDFRNEKLIDIVLEKDSTNYKVGIDNITEVGSDYERPPSLNYDGIKIWIKDDSDDEKMEADYKYNLIYHNILTTISRILVNSDIGTKSDGTKTNDVPVVVNEIGINEQGGRSLSGSFDGSVEFAVGSDTVDKKSLILDTAGSVINRIGRDKSGRSVITQTDGDVLMQIGGRGVRDSEDSRFSNVSNVSSFKAGTFILQIVTLNDHSQRKSWLPENTTTFSDQISNDQIIRITKDGIELFVNGNLNFDVNGNIEMCASGTINIRSPEMYLQPGYTGKANPNGPNKPKKVAVNSSPTVNSQHG